MNSGTQPDVSGHSVWLTFGKQTRQIARLIRELSIRLGTEPFPPHITLAGQLSLPREQIIKKLSWMASVTDPFRVSCRQFGHESFWFRAFFLDVAPNRALTGLRDMAMKQFGLPEVDKGYLPHISLVYGEPDAATIERVRLELAAWLPVTFDVTRIVLVKTEGKTAEWKVVQEFELGD